MGYLTSLSGYLNIEPPLTYAEFKGSPFTSFETDDGADILALTVEEHDVETVEGTLTVKTATAIEPYEDSVKAYDIEEKLQRIVDAFPGHAFTGCIEGDGQDQGDVWRLYVRNGRVVKIEPTITWPEEL